MYKNMTGSFKDEIEAFKQEFESYYSKYPVDVTELYSKLDELDSESSDKTPYERKALIYKVAEKYCDVHVFRHCPFYFEIVTGRERNSVTSGFPPGPGIDGWMMKKNPDLQREFEGWCKEYKEKDILFTTMFTDFAHHYVGCDNVLREGLGGIIRKAKDRLKTAKTIKEKAFLESVIAGNQALIGIAKKFAAKAREMLAVEDNPAVRNRLERIADTAERVPENPPATFYEALNTIWFMREACNSLEGVGFAVVGHLDRLLEKYYLADLKKGRITREEAKDLISWFLSLTDAKWDLSDTPTGTNTTVVIGGCDENGKIVFNDITRMVIEAFGEYRLVNPKLQARISSKHPQEYFDLLGNLAATGSNVLSIFNDDVLIQAHVKEGKRLEDSRLYVAGGCQEPLLANTENNCRAYAYINLPQLLNMTLFPDEWDFWRKEGIEVKRVDSCDSFEEFYSNFISNVKSASKKLASRFNEYEKQWWEYNPCPIYSSTIDDCIEKAKDVTEGGARYNPNSFSYVGIGTLIDSLYAISEAVFEKKVLTLEELKGHLKSNFANGEYIRQYLLNRIPKYGQDNEKINSFAGRVFSDIAEATSGMPNARGGTYEASLFAFHAYDWMKRNTGATPDGRKAGEVLSRGMGPSEQSRSNEISKILHTLDSIDMTRYPGSGVLYLDMPYTQTKVDPRIFAQIIKYFLEKGGCVFDFNIIDPEKLKEAKLHPEKHQNLVVRVCGFSAYFTSLDPEVQDEIINRTLKQ